jgi:hypothetical protein
MLAANKYPQAYVDECRSRVALQMSTYQALAKAGAARAIEPFEHQFFNHMVLVLDYLFVHRTRALEKKDGNPLNEVRMICNSLLQNQGVLAADNAIKLDPSKSILGLHVGDEIRMNAADFQRLNDAFFDEIEAKFT